MSNVPDGAQLSEDGQWWWDGGNWQAVVQDGGGDGGQSGGDGGQSGGDGGDPRAAALAALGVATIEDLPDDQRSAYINEPTIEVQAVDAGEADVVAMNESSDNTGEATA